MNITTQEGAKVIFDRAREYCLAKYGENIDCLKIFDDGSLVAIASSWRQDEEDEHYPISNENLLDCNLDELTKQRAEREKQEKEKAEAHRKETERLKNKSDKEKRRQEYIKLHKEFGGEIEL